MHPFFNAFLKYFLNKCEIFQFSVGDYPKFKVQQFKFLVGDRAHILAQISGTYGQRAVSTCSCSFK